MFVLLVGLVVSKVKYTINLCSASLSELLMCLRDHL